MLGLFYFLWTLSVFNISIVFSYGDEGGGAGGHNSVSAKQDSQLQVCGSNLYTTAPWVTPANSQRHQGMIQISEENIATFNIC